MKVEQIYTGCLAHGAYYIESAGEATIIDPLREVKPYIDMANEHGAKIKYIFETHFHADFLSGHIDLAKKTGASIVYGPTEMKTGFDFVQAIDGQIFKLGNIQIQLLHTPGHTMESSCYLLKNEQGKDTAIFTGDTLFIGDVGRPDLAQHVIAELTEEKLAGHLYDSLRNKIMPLADDIIVYPAHGAGSTCGKNLSKETSDTLGHQKETNYALQTNLSKEAFIKEVLSGLMPPPGYFPKNVLMNINGYDSIDEVMNRGARSLSVAEFETLTNEKDVLIIDTRADKLFAQGFVPGSINIGINGSFATWVGTLIPDIKQKIVLVTEVGKEQEAVIRLARVGYDQALGFLQGGFDTWKNAGMALDQIKSISVDEFAEIKDADNTIEVLDVRKKSEHISEQIENTINIPLDFINESMHLIDKNKTYYVHCAGGYRSMVFVSILKARGYDKLIDVEGGLSAIKASNKFKVTDYICPTSML